MPSFGKIRYKCAPTVRCDMYRRQAISLLLSPAAASSATSSSCAVSGSRWPASRRCLTGAVAASSANRPNGVVISLGLTAGNLLTSFAAGPHAGPASFAEAGRITMTPSQRFDTMRTERLLMRRWRESDREPFAALNGDAETLKYFPSTLDRAASDAMVDRIEACFDALGYGLWALEVTSTGQFIGFTGLNPMPDDVPGAGGVEVGWRLARPAWHPGYATTAARAGLH